MKGILTTSLEVSKRLKEAGFERDPEIKGYYWCLNKVNPDYCQLKDWYEVNWDNQWLIAIPAFNLSELIRELPDDYFVSKDGRVFQRTHKTFPVEWVLITDNDTPENACGIIIADELKKEKGE